MNRSKRPFLTRPELNEMIAGHEEAKRIIGRFIGEFGEIMTALLGMNESLLDGLNKALAEIERLKAESN